MILYKILTMHNIEKIIEVLQDYNAFDIKQYKDPANWIQNAIVCSSTSSRQAYTLLERIKRLDVGERAFYDDRSPTWIVLEFSFCVVHIFEEETRNYYSLDEMWDKRVE